MTLRSLITSRRRMFYNCIKCIFVILIFSYLHSCCIWWGFSIHFIIVNHRLPIR
eukprot:UN20734